MIKIEKTRNQHFINWKGMSGIISIEDNKLIDAQLNISNSENIYYNVDCNINISFNVANPTQILHQYQMMLEFIEEIKKQFNLT